MAETPDSDTPVLTTPDESPESPAPAPRVTVSPTTPNYHIQLWPEPPGPSTYLCLVPECGFKDATEAEVQAHVVSVHAVPAVPTPLAADANMIASFMLQEESRGGDQPNILDGSER